MVVGQLLRTLDGQIRVSPIVDILYRPSYKYIALYTVDRSFASLQVLSALFAPF